jgi:hypothetical protein
MRLTIKNAMVLWNVFQNECHTDNGPRDRCLGQLLQPDLRYSYVGLAIARAAGHLLFAAFSMRSSPQTQHPKQGRVGMMS